jgi:hypothetical protein
VTTNYGDRGTPENIAGTHLTRCVHMLLLQFKRLLVPRPPSGRDDEATFGPEFDATFYAYALWHSVQVAEMCRPFNPDKIDRAIATFERAVPDYRNVRNVLAHFDAYEPDERARFADVVAALQDGAHFLEYDPVGHVLRVGGLDLDVVGSYFAANQLLATVLAVLMPGAFPDLEPFLTRRPRGGETGAVGRDAAGGAGRFVQPPGQQ